MMTKLARSQRHRQGSALFIAMLLLVMMGIIGLAALETVTRDQQVAGFLNRKKLAFWAAEGGVSEALEKLRTAGDPAAITTTALADSSTFPTGQPEYQIDGAVETVGEPGAYPEMNLRIDQNGEPLFQLQYYRMTVLGTAPGGSRARIEFASGALVTN